MINGGGFQAPETLGPSFVKGDDIVHGREVGQSFKELIGKLEELHGTVLVLIFSVCMKP